MVSSQQIGALCLLMMGSFLVMQNKAQYKITLLSPTFIAKGEEYIPHTRIERDPWGKAHIYGDTDITCAFSVAIAACEDNFRKIQHNFVTSKAVRSRVFGYESIGEDFLLHWMGISDLAHSNYHSLSMTEQKMCEAYADGINYYAALHESELLHNAIFPITGEDIITHYFYIIQDIVQLESLASVLHSRKNVSVPISQRSLPLKGSTAYATSPIRSKDGETFLAINPHQSWKSPLSYYEIHVTSEEGWNFKGFILPGLPIPFMGFNPHLGWAHTVNHPDIVDVFQLKLNPDNEKEYWFEDAWISFDNYTKSSHYVQWGLFNRSVEHTIEVSKFGPVVRTPSGTVAVSFSGFHSSCVHFIEQYMGMSKATTLGEWEEYHKILAMPLMNTLYADAEGNILYHYTAKIPLRSPNYDWKYRIETVHRNVLWTTFVEYEDLPRVLNPSSGFLQNCNTSPFQVSSVGNPLVSEYAKEMGIEETMNNRGLRALDLLRKNENISWDEFMRLKFDVVYDNASSMVALKDKLHDYCEKALADQDAWAISSKELLQEGLMILRDWDHTASIDNPYATLPLLTLYPFIQAAPWAFDPSSIVQTNFQTVADRFLVVCKSLNKFYGGLDITWGTINRLIDSSESVDIPLPGSIDLLFNSTLLHSDRSHLLTLTSAMGNPTSDNRIEVSAGDGVFMFIRWNEKGEVSSETLDLYDTKNKQHLLYQNKLMKNSGFELHA